MAALHFVGVGEDHVVAQIVKAEFVVGAVSDVGLVRLLFLGEVLLGHDDASAQAEGVIQLAHPLAIAPRQVIINRNYMHAVARYCLQVRRQGGDQSLALTGAHFGDVAGN